VAERIDPALVSNREAPMIVVDRFKTSRMRVVPALLLAALGLLALGLPPGRADGPPPVAPAPADRPPQLLRPGDPHAHGLSDKDLDDLRAILRSAVDDQVVPGISLLLAHRGEVIFKEAYGNLKVDQKVQMASSSKSVTATLLMILVDRGKLALDDPVEKYLPEFKGITLKGKPPARPPTVRHVLSNTSGLPGDLLTQSIIRRLRERAAQAKGQAKPEDVGADIDDAIAKNGAEAKKARAQFLGGQNTSLAESVRQLAHDSLATEPGAEFHYCTMGFNVAARVAEVASGRPFEELVRDELLEPLGMKDTRYLPVGLPALRAGATLPNGESRFIIAGGSMTSTLDDFAAFYQMQLNSGTYRGRRILSEKSVTAMQTRQGRLDLLMAGPYGGHYGLAFFLDRLDDQERGHLITHPGFFGTNPWLDRDRDLIGVLFVQSNFLRIMPTVRRLHDKLRTSVPVSHQP
jgi:CubicO group peptidase (beta-lactamase class C family)